MDVPWLVTRHSSSANTLSLDHSRYGRVATPALITGFWQRGLVMCDCGETASCWTMGWSSRLLLTADSATISITSTKNGTWGQWYITTQLAAPFALLPHWHGAPPTYTGWS